MINEHDDLITIPFVTLNAVKKTFSIEAILTNSRVQSLSEGQQLGYMKAIADVTAYLESVYDSERG